MKKCLSLIVLLFLCSCATDIDYFIPVNRFETPETSGRLFGGKIELNVPTAVHVEMGEVYEDIFFGSGIHTSENTYVDKAVTAAVQLDFGLLSRLDFFYKTIYDATDILGFKFQFYGEPRNKWAEGLKLAVTAGGGAEDLDNETVTLKTEDGSEKDFTSSLDSKAIDFSFIAGYRLTPYSLVYLNTFYTKYWLDGSISSETQVELSQKGKSETYGTALGYRLGQRWYVDFEVGSSKSRHEKIRKRVDSFGIATGFAW